MKQYDYLIVGAGLYGAVFAQEAKKAGKKCLVIDKRGHIAGNIYTEQVASSPACTRPMRSLLCTAMWTAWSRWAACIWIDPYRREDQDVKRNCRI